MHLQENSIFDLDLGVKVTQSVAQQARRKQLQIGGAHTIFFTDWGGGGGAHIIFFKMTDLCNEQYSIFVQIIGGGGTDGPRAPPPPIPTALPSTLNIM